MKIPLSHLAVLAALFLAAGCANPDRSAGTTPAAGEKTAAAPTGEGHADLATVVPGSYQDWCTEHEVPESQCTRCDPSLVPAFQAAGDWDAEHGLPLSQCRIHDPDLRIVRPPKPEGR